MLVVVIRLRRSFVPFFCLFQANALLFDSVKKHKKQFFAQSKHQELELENRVTHHTTTVTTTAVVSFPKKYEKSVLYFEQTLLITYKKTCAEYHSTILYHVLWNVSLWNIILQNWNTKIYSFFVATDCEGTYRSKLEVSLFVLGVQTC